MPRASFPRAYAFERVESDAPPTGLYTTEYVRVRVVADTLRLNAVVGDPR